MPKVRVIHGRHNGRDEKGKPVIYEAGDEFETTDARLAAFKGKLEAVDKEVKKAKDKAPVEFDVEKADKDALLKKAKELDIEVDSRWGEKRLREVVAEALA